MDLMTYTSLITGDKLLEPKEDSSDTKVLEKKEQKYVVRGEWVQGEYEWEFDYWACSACKAELKFEYGSPQDYGIKYCPNCGAMMEGNNG